MRITWTDLPEHVRGAVEAILGDTVVAAESQPGGFSPGTADRVRTANGSRAFVKAVSPAQNDLTPVLHRREAVVSAALPATVPAPRFLGCHDDGEWVALVLEDVDGRHPATPWTRPELDQVLAALERVASVTSVPGLSAVADEFSEDFAGWRRVAADPPEDLDPWARGHLDDLVALADRGLSSLDGEALVHFDLRADNILLRADGGVAIVDWPWACRGPAWLDTVALLVNVRLHGGHDTGALLAEHAPGADAGSVLGVLAGLAGAFVDTARRPPPAGLPTLRAFQRAQGEATLSWVRELLEGGYRPKFWVQ
ncbi:MAG: phosphotransferase [Umezawaea sp.]